MNGKRVLKKPASSGGTLSSYLTGLVSLILASALLLGTTYAWLTGDTSSSGNRIKSGRLSVQLAHLTEDNAAVVLGQTGRHQVFSNSVRWTPGRTEIETVRVANTGSLDLRYRLDFAIDPDRPVPAQLTDLFTAYVKEGKAGDNEDPTTGNGWTELGTLTQLTDEQGQLSLGEGVLLAKRSEPVVLSIALRLTDDVIAVSGAMGRSLTVSLQLDAYQQLDDTASALN